MLPPEVLSQMTPRDRHEYRRQADFEEMRRNVEIYVNTLRSVSPAARDMIARSHVTAFVNAWGENNPAPRIAGVQMPIGSFEPIQ